MQALNGVEQAVEDFNAAGGILGEKIVLEFQDDAGEPKQAVSVGNVLIALTASGATALRQARPLIEEAHATFFGPHEGVADDLRSTLRDLAARHASQRLL